MSINTLMSRRLICSAHRMASRKHRSSAIGQWLAWIAFADKAKKLGSPKVSPKFVVAGNSILKVATLVGVGRGTVERMKREMVGVAGRS